MSNYKKIYCPCDDCQYSYSKNGQEMNTCNICEYKYLKDSWENNIDEVVEQLEKEKEYQKKNAIDKNFRIGVVNGLNAAIRIVKGVRK